MLDFLRFNLIDNPYNYGVFLGLLSAIFILCYYHEKYDDRSFVSKLFYFIFVMLFCTAIIIPNLYLAVVYHDRGAGFFIKYYRHVITDALSMIILLPLTSFILKLTFLRYILPQVSTLLRAMRTQIAPSSLSDIRLAANDKWTVNFNPIDYFKKGFIFCGIEKPSKDFSIFRWLLQRQDPVYIPYEDAKQMHSAYVGRSTLGKGVGLVSAICQYIFHGSPAIIVDVKPDKFMRHVIFDICKRYGQDYIELNFDLGNATCAFEPFMYDSVSDRREFLYEQLDMADTKDPAVNHYRSIIRDYLDDFVLNRWDGSFWDIYDMIMSMPDDYKMQAQKEHIHMMSLLPSISRDLPVVTFDDIYRNDAILYIIANKDNKVSMKAVNMIAERLLEFARRRALPYNKHCAVAWDELRFGVTESIANAYSTLLGFGINFHTTYQSPTDPSNAGDTAREGMVIANSIDTNTGLKFIHQTMSNKEAMTFSENTGMKTIQVLDRQMIETNYAGGDEFKGTGYQTTKNESLIPPEVFHTLSRNQSVMFNGNGLAKVVMNDIIKTDITRAIDITPPSYVAAKTPHVTTQDFDNLEDFLPTTRASMKSPRIKSKKTDDDYDGLFEDT